MVISIRVVFASFAEMQRVNLVRAQRDCAVLSEQWARIEGLACRGLVVLFRRLFAVARVTQRGVEL